MSLKWTLGIYTYMVNIQHRVDCVITACVYYIIVAPALLLHANCKIMKHQKTQIVCLASFFFFCWKWRRNKNTKLCSGKPLIFIEYTIQHAVCSAHSEHSKPKNHNVRKTANNNNNKTVEKINGNTRNKKIKFKKKKQQPKGGFQMKRACLCIFEMFF